MASRSGMANLILRLRGLTEAGASDYSVNGVAYWTDNQLQDVLDSHVERIDQRELVGAYEYLSGATIWKDYPVGYTDLEEVASGIPYWSLVTSAGVEVSTSLYTLDPLGGIIRFTADQAGAVFFLKARSYSLALAAAEVWRAKAGHTAGLYNFTTEGQSFSRAQWYDHCVMMAEKFERQEGVKSVPLFRSDLQ